jgi:hypothetical protein
MDFLPEQKNVSQANTLDRKETSQIRKTNNNFESVIEEEEENDGDSSNNNMINEEEEPDWEEDLQKYEQVDYISQMKIGCKTTKNEVESFETDIYSMDVLISLSDGEIENFIGRNKTPANPHVELAFDNLIINS